MNTAGVRGIGSDPTAFEAFYREYLDAIHGFVARRVNDVELAADLTADIFLAAIENAGGYSPERGAPIAWLYGIARNVVSGHARSAARELRAVSRVAGRRLLDADSMARAEERLDAQRELRAVYRAILALPESDQQLLELVVLEQLSLIDAARVLGVKPVAARVRLHRSRRLLHTHLQRVDSPSAAEPIKEVTP